MTTRLSGEQVSRGVGEILDCVLRVIRVFCLGAGLPGLALDREAVEPCASVQHPFAQEAAALTEPQSFLWSDRESTRTTRQEKGARGSMEQGQRPSWAWRARNPFSTTA